MKITEKAHPLNLNKCCFAAALTVTICGRLLPARGEESRVAADRATLARVAADWQARHRTLAGAEYRFVGTITFKKGSYRDLPREELPPGTTGDVPASDEQFPIETMILLDFHGGRVRKEFLDYAFAPKALVFEHARRAYVFDGQSMRNRQLDVAERRDELEERGRIAVEMVVGGNFEYSFFDYVDYAVLCGHGVVPRLANLATAAVKITPSTEGYGVYGNGVEDGRPIVVLRTPSVEGTNGTFAELWVDVPRGSAVTRWVTHSEGKERLRLEIENAETHYGWLPNRWRMTRSARDGSIETTEAVELTQFNPETNLAPARFREEIQRGMVVRDNAERKVYKYMGPNESPVPEEELARQRLGSHGAFAGALRWVLAAVASLALLFGGTRLLRGASKNRDVPR